MNETVQPSSTVKGLGRGQIVFLLALLAAGLFFLGWTVVLYLTPTPRPPDIARQAREYLRSRNVQPLSDPLAKLLADSDKWLVKSQAHPLLGHTAPSFELADHHEQHYQLDRLLSKGPVVLVFYYGYYCNHCVGQLFALGDDIQKFWELRAEVVAISADPAKLTRERFRQYGEFAFPVLSDPGNKTAQVYGVFQRASGSQEEVLLHGTFVIGRDSIVAWAQCSDEPFTENRTLLYELARLEGRLPEPKPQEAASATGQPSE